MELTIVGATEGDAARYPVPLSDHVLYLIVGIREAGAYPPVDVLEALDAVLMLGDGGVVDEVLRQELVEDVQIVIVIDLLYQPADDCLVLFCGHEGLLSIELRN